MIYGLGKWFKTQKFLETLAECFQIMSTCTQVYSPVNSRFQNSELIPPLQSFNRLTPYDNLATSLSLEATSLPPPPKSQSEMLRRRLRSWFCKAQSTDLNVFPFKYVEVLNVTEMATFSPTFRVFQDLCKLLEPLISFKAGFTISGNVFCSSPTLL